VQARDISVLVDLLYEKNHIIDREYDVKIVTVYYGVIIKGYLQVHVVIITYCSQNSVNGVNCFC